MDEEFDSDITTDTDSDSSDGGASVSEGNGEEGRRRKCHDGDDDSGGSDSNGGGPGSTPSEQGEKERRGERERGQLMRSRWNRLDALQVQAEARVPPHHSWWHLKTSSCPNQKGREVKCLKAKVLGLAKEDPL